MLSQVYSLIIEQRMRMIWEALTMCTHPHKLSIKREI